MRLVLTTVLVFASSAAFASSIMEMRGTQRFSSSIVEKRCADCPVTEAKADESTYKVPELAPGTQKMEIVDINGEKKLARTEAWLGGSPVIYVSKLPEWLAGEKAVAEIHPTTNGSTEMQIEEAEASGDGIDVAATTSAVEAISKADTGIIEASAIQKPLALGTFQLRFN
ncbi:hypothetical protein SAMN02982989_2292 [Xaviernesmea oryzae]|uniref:Uncharacterized protein n=1 Tax=Xaviernesmea oryzae TaxID=464029 RepID=A0A1X7F463_9HYPH|nr:plant virulence effector HPE1-like domain-containing protein [Xaviernesmea oryzae]SMF45577.1 hypothetical protein SAMN02982989_2292 [Xaviernesmea oryzae]